MLREGPLSMFGEGKHRPRVEPSGRSRPTPSRTTPLRIPYPALTKDPPMTPEKKRLLWILLAILFFFANLTLIVILLLNNLSTHPTPHP